MRQKSGPEKQPAEQVVKNIRRATRRQFSAEEKIRIVLEGLRVRRAWRSCAAVLLSVGGRAAGHERSDEGCHTKMLELHEVVS